MRSPVTTPGPFAVGHTGEDLPDGPTRAVPEPAPASSEDAFGGRLEDMQRTHSWAGPTRNSWVVTVGAQPVRIATYEPDRLELRISCPTTSATPVAVGGPRVTYPLADAGAGDSQPTAGDLIAVGGALHPFYQRSAPAETWAVAAEGATAQVCITEFRRSLRRT